MHLETTNSRDRSADLQPVAMSAAIAALPWVLVASVPVLFALATWDTSGVHPGMRDWIRQTGAPAVVVEIVIIVLAVTRGFDPLATLNRQPLWLRACLLALLGIAFGTAVTVAVDPLRALTWTFIWIVHLLFGLSVFCLARSLDLRTREMVWPAVVVGLCGYALLVIAFVYSVPKGIPFNWERFPLAGANVRHIGYYSAIGGAAAAGLIAVKTGAGRLLAGLALVFLLALSFWSGSRGSVIAVWLALGVGAVCLRSVRSIRAWATLAGCTAASIALSMLGPAPSGLFGMHRMVLSVRAQSADSLTSGRLQLWADTLHAVIRRPWFGYGQGQFPHVVYSQGLFNQPHNILLQLLLDLGVVGTALALALAGFVLMRCRASFSSAAPGQVPAVLVAAAVFTMALYDGTLFYSYPTMMFVFALALLIGSNVDDADPVRVDPAPSS